MSGDQDSWLTGQALKRLDAHVKKSAQKDPVPPQVDPARAQSRLDQVTTSLDKAVPSFVGKPTVTDAGKSAWAKSALEATRKRAEGWRSGAAATLALVLASLAIKPGDGLMKYTGGTRVLLMALVGLSVLSALLSVYRLLRAANGPAWLVDLPEDAQPARYYRRLASARLDLQIGQFLWLISIGLFSGAVAVTWIQTPVP